MKEIKVTEKRYVCDNCGGKHKLQTKIFKDYLSEKEICSSCAKKIEIDYLDVSTYEMEYETVCDISEAPFVFINYKITPVWIMPPPCRGNGRALRDRCAQKCAPDSLLSVVAASVPPDFLCQQPLVQGLRPSVFRMPWFPSVSLLYPVYGPISIDIFDVFFMLMLC